MYSSARPPHSFAFLPRKVASTSKTSSQKVNASLNLVSSTKGKEKVLAERNENNEKNSVASKSVNKDGQPANSEHRYSEKDYAMLVWLALSHYALWADPNIRKRIESGDDGYIPLVALLQHSQAISHLNLQNSEIAVAKALRAYADDVMDVRMLVAPASSSNWRWIRPLSEHTGSYEVRRKGRDSNAVAGSSKLYWDERTLYMENVPHKHASLAGTASFVSSLLENEHPFHIVQAVTFLPHHLDKLGDVPKPKPFALVTLSSLDAVQLLLEAWAWERNARKTRDKDESDMPAVQEAVKVGFRVLKKSKWQTLNDEYLAYRRRILSTIPVDEEMAPPTATLTSTAPKAAASATSSVNGTAKASNKSRDSNSRKISLDSPYPYDCLVFIKNIHIETNKTTLKTLFSRATKDGEGAKGISYVDYTKGMDNCHLRLSSPGCAHALVNYFSSEPRCQTSGLDDIGKGINKGNANDHNQRTVVVAELVQGRREEIYWEKVPEKVRKEAVRQSIGSTIETGIKDVDGRERKRRRKG